VSRVLAGVIMRLVPDPLVRKHTLYQERQSDRRKQEKKHPHIAVVVGHQVNRQPVQPDEERGHVEIAGEKARGHCHANLRCQNSHS
jgi:hypothetical protein